MEATLNSSDIKKARIRKEDINDHYEAITMLREGNITSDTFRKISDSLGGRLPTIKVGMAPAINLAVLTMNDGREKLLGVIISEEGDYRGKNRDLKGFSGRALDTHISLNDPKATHLRVTYWDPPEDIRKELITALNEKFKRNIKE